MKKVKLFHPRSWNQPLSEENYLKQRLKPSAWDLNYLPLRDLLVVVKELVSSISLGGVFDYGCGGAPYRGVFAPCTGYVGADITPGPAVDKVLGSDGQTGEPDASYDTVFSSQVLEHVAEPSVYLAEAYRILKPGGHLILTTHGMFLEHGCPHDFYRWTGYGLDKLVSSAGFTTHKVVKITPGTRASIYLVNCAIDNAGTRYHWLPHLSIALCRRVWAITIRPLSHLLAPSLDPRAFVPGNAREPIYIGVGILAQKS